MDQVIALEEALGVQLEVVGRLDPSEMRRPSACPGWSLRDVLNHSVGVTRKFAEFASGSTDAPRTPEGDLVGTDAQAALAAVASTAGAAWRGADRRRMCRLRFGTFTSDQAAGINLFDVLAHTWDVASPLDIAVDCPDTLWDTALAAFDSVLRHGRDSSHYGPEIPSPPGASSMDRFLHATGRSTPPRRADR
ncbi:MAG: TIGR03086 family metal-binding protein [Acidimicrobiales bacterium]